MLAKVVVKMVVDAVGYAVSGDIRVTACGYHSQQPSNNVVLTPIRLILYTESK